MELSMIKQLLLSRINFWIKKYKQSKNELIKHSIELVLNELLVITKDLYDSHLIGICTYLQIENKIKSKEK